jgi:hypothetical protein
MDQDAKVKCGDVSAILMSNLPIIGDFLKAHEPKNSVREKLEYKIKFNSRKYCIQRIFTSLSGVPSWMLLVLKEVLRIFRKQSIAEVWPELEVYFHEGFSFLHIKKNINI